MNRDIWVTVLIWTAVVVFSLTCWALFLRSVAELFYR